MKLNIPPLKPWQHSLLFIIAGILVAFYFEYPQIFDLAPQSAHYWRQADSASIALNYYQDGYHFFKPRVHHNLVAEGEAVAEFPIIYYLSAILYGLFGVKEGLFRTLNFVFVFVGLWAFAKSIKSILNDDFLSLTIPLLIWSSPILAYYSFNFLPNAPALGIVFIGWYFTWLFYQNEKNKHWYWGIFFFTIAALIKPTTLIHLGAISLLWLLHLRDEKLNIWTEVKKRKKQVYSVGLLFIFVGCWIAFAKYYNNKYDSGLFMMTLKPIWTADTKTIIKVFNKNVFKVSQYYFALPSHVLVIIMSLLIFTFVKWKDLFFRLFVILLLGVLILVAGWYQQFDIHYYYAIEYLVFPAIVFVCFFREVNKRFPKLIKSWFFKIAFLSFLLFNLYQTRGELKYRYNGDNKFNAQFSHTAHEIKPLRKHLRSLGLKPEDKVLALPDHSPNCLLYLVNQKGYSGFDSRGAPLSDERIQRFVNKQGIRFLIIASEEYLSKQPAKELLAYPMESYKDIKIFDLRPFVE